VPKLATLAVAGAGSLVLFVAVNHRDALDRGLTNTTAEHQGGELIVITLLVCAAVGLAQLAIARWAELASRPAWMRVSRANALRGLIGAAALGLVIAIAAGAPGRLHDEWNTFKSREGTDPKSESRGSQIVNFSGSGRYQFWQAAVDAYRTDPLKGIGPGTFDFWWARNGSYSGYVRDAHSLYVENLAELGLVGFLLIAGMSVAVIATGAVRTMRAPPELRVGLAAATAGCTAFVAAAAVDWLWELGAIPLVFFALAAIACAGGVEARRAGESTGYDHFWPRNRGRIALVVLSLAGLAVIVQPLWSSIELERSYDAEADGRRTDALADARNALDVQPYSASAHLQEAVLLEDRGQLEQATDAAKAATDEEPTNWLPWYVLARIEARAGDQGRADAHWRTSRSLNPRSGVFSTGPPGHGKASE
jgi:hypothetical protein